MRPRENVRYRREQHVATVESSDGLGKAKLPLSERQEAGDADQR
jgi:hypothetical protein